MRLYLVRHGETQWNREGRLLGWTDLPLTPEGEAQARALAQELKGLRPDGVYSSDLKRALRTAELAWGEAEPVSALREIHFGLLEGALWEELDPSYQEALLRFQGFKAPGGESLEDLEARVLGFLEGLSRGTYLLFTHGGVVRLLLRRYAQDAFVPPGSLVVLDLPEGGHTGDAPPPLAPGGPGAGR